MKVSDFVLNFLSEHGVKHVFLITGGVIVPLVDAFAGREDIRYICVQHEQAAAMAADGYARFAGLGCAMATSGPGATNLITGIGCSYFDSIPVIYITGQVNTREAKGSSGVRQRGFQETDIVSIVQPITKFARYVAEKEDIQYVLEAALWYAQEGRPGPVLVDIPINIQQEEIDPYTLMHFGPPRESRTRIDTTVIEELISKAEKPVIIYGQGCRKYKAQLLKFIEKSGIPCLPSWAALDLIPHEHDQFLSQFGVYGCRAGNFAVQNADLVLALGTRLDSRMTGSKGFAPKAKIVMVNHDKSEMDKIDCIQVHADVGKFLRSITVEHKDYESWYAQIKEWWEKYKIVPPADFSMKLNPITFVNGLCEALPDDAILVADAGANLSWVQQAIRIKGTQRIFSAYGYSPMGYSLPAAIGAHYATGKQVVCLIGDGGVQINIQEFQTLFRYQIPVKVFVFNNEGYGIIRQFQDELCEGRHEATDNQHGVSNPDFSAVAKAYKITGLKLIQRAEVNVTLFVGITLHMVGPVVCDVILDPLARIEPKTRYGSPLDKQYPLLENVI